MYQKLIDWSKKEFSHLPWREDRTLYKTLVSEIMLQQTTVSTVRNHFNQFLLKFPDIKKLSLATEEEVLIAWKGLGYYRRAKNLKKIADYIVMECHGQIPKDLDHLLQIPGIGPYTANALLTIGMNIDGLPIDANLERVLSRIYAVKLPKGLKLHQALLNLYQKKKILHESKFQPRDLYEALMDLGRNFCQANKTSCELCPLSKNCQAYKSKKPLEYPVKSLKIKNKKEQLQLLRILVIKMDKVLAYKKNEDEWLGGQWEVPTYMILSTDNKISQYPKYIKKINLQNLRMIKTSITKYEITNFLVNLTETEWAKLNWQREVKWLAKSDWNRLSTASLKVIKLNASFIKKTE